MFWEWENKGRNVFNCGLFVMNHFKIVLKIKKIESLKLI